jgi:tetratricopeptide (TPR) repeat protein
MYNLLISLAISGAVCALLYFGAGIEIGYAVLAMAVVYVAAFFVLSRIYMKKLTALMQVAERDMQAGRIDKAVKVLESGFRYSKWQLYVKPQLNAQIGMVYYLKRDFRKAFGYLQHGLTRNWASMAMLGICYMKRNKPKEMKKTFEKALRTTKKEPLLYNLYALCLDKMGDKDRAVDIMEKGIKKTADDRLVGNLAALKEGRKMKMLPYGELWHQFHLEKPGTLIKQQTKAVQGRRKTIKR